MIAEECKKLREQLENVAKAEELENIHEQLESRRIELVDVRDALLAVTNSLKALSARTELVGNLDPTKCIGRVRKIRESLQTDPLSITKGRQFSDMRKAFEKFAAEGTECAQATWAQFVPRAKPSVDSNQLAQAETLPTYAKVTSKLRLRAKDADRLGKKPPSTEEEFLAIESLWDDIVKMMDELPPAAEEPEVQEFLKASNSPGGAPIEMLTEEVWAWLKEKNMIDKYRVNNIS